MGGGMSMSMGRPGGGMRPGSGPPAEPPKDLRGTLRRLLAKTALVVVYVPHVFTEMCKSVPRAHREWVNELRNMATYLKD